MADTEALLRAFLSSDNSVRKAAEAQLEALRKANTDNLPALLVQVARAAVATELRSVSAVLFRRVVNANVKDDIVHWETISAPVRAALRAELLAALQAEPEPYIRRLLVDTISEVAIVSMDALQEEWPELWSLVYAWAQGADYAQQECAMLFLDYLGGPVAERFQEQFAQLQALFSQRISDAAAPASLRVAACSAAISLLTELPTRSSDADGFVVLVPHMLALFSGLVTVRSDEKARELSSLLCDIAETHTNLLKTSMEQILHLAHAVGMNPEMDNATRRCMVEFLVVIAERTPGVARKVPNRGFLAALLPVLMLMLTEHGEDAETVEEWERNDSSYFDTLDDTCNVDAAEDALNRVGFNLGGKFVLPALTPIIEAYMGHADWKHRFAALDALSRVTDIIPDSSSVQCQLARQVTAFITDPHPRVRHAALAVIANLCTYNGPEFQRRTHATICPAMLAALKDPSRRVRVQACLSVAIFNDHLLPGVDEDVTGPYVRDMLVACFGMLSGGDGWMQEQALVAVSALLEGSGTLLAPYFDELMPPVRELLASMEPAPELLAAAVMPGKDHATRKVRQAAQERVQHMRKMKGRALECATLLGQTVPVEKFRPDAALLMTNIVSMLQIAEHHRAAAAHAAAVSAHTTTLVGGGSAEGAAAAAAAASTSALASLSSMGSPIEDDPVTRYIWEAIGRLAEVLQDEFAPFVASVLPPLLAEASRFTPVTTVSRKVASQEGGAAELHGDDAGDEEDEEDGPWEDDPEVTEIERGEIKMRVKSAALNDKLSAVSGIGAIVGHIKGAVIAPYCAAVVQTLIPLLRLEAAPSDDIRTRAAGILSDCLAGACAAVRASDLLIAFKVTSGAPAPAGVAAVSRAALDLLALASESASAIVKALNEEREAYTVHETLDAFVIALLHAVVEPCSRRHYADAAEAEAAGIPTYVPLLQPAQLAEITEALLLVRQGALQRRAIRFSELRVHADEYDEEAKEALNEDDKEDFELMFHCFDVFGALLKTHRQVYLPLYQQRLAPLIVDMYHPQCVAEDRRLAAFLFCDLIEHLGDEAVDGSGAHYLHTYIPGMLSGMQDSDAAVRQAVIFGLGTAAETCHTAFAPFLQGVVTALIAHIQSPPTGTWTEVEDNAVTALAKTVIHAIPAGFAGGNGIPARTDIMELIVSKLPLAFDRDEGSVALNMLCMWLERNDADLLGGPAATADTNFARLLRCLQAFGVALCEIAYCNSDLTKRIGRALVQLQTSLGADAIARLWSPLTAEQRTALTAAAQASLT